MFHGHQESFDIRTIFKVGVITPPSDLTRGIIYNGLFCKSNSKCEHLPYNSQGTLFKINLPNSWDEHREAINIFPKLTLKITKTFAKLSTLSLPCTSIGILAQCLLGGALPETAVNAVPVQSIPGCSYGSSMAVQCRAGGLAVSCQVLCCIHIGSCLASTLV